jgi:transglutaminase-like putative cysteine protease
MIYSIRHTTTFRYEPAVRESVMEVRLQPRSEAQQRCIKFQLDVDPSAHIMEYRDFMGNSVHHFDIAQTHRELQVKAVSLVEVQAGTPPAASSSGDWADLDAAVAADDHWEMLLPSQFARSATELETLASDLKCTQRRGNPLDLVTELNQAIYQSFSYVPNSTRVDSPIDEALRTRQGVCQDFAHIMIALLRPLRIPARYVSGYLFHAEEKQDRSLEGASHAWVEVLVPRLGWTAFDPTNNLVGGDRHIRVAVGRDYADVPPTRGVFKGDTQSELIVAVTVSSSNLPSEQQIAQPVVSRSRPIFVPGFARMEQEQQQQQ